MVRDAELMRVRPDADLALVRKRANRIAASEAASLARFGLRAPLRDAAARSSGTIYQREPEPKGPMSGFGYSWLDDQLDKAKVARPALLDRETVREGPSFAYEALNLVDGARSVADIREELEWTIGPVPESEVGDYLATLEKLGLLTRRGK